MICKKLIGKLGPSEEITVVSEEKKGSKFSFYIY